MPPTNQEQIEQIAVSAAAAAAAVVANDILHIKTDMADIKLSIDRMCGTYLTRIEFDPVKKVVYGLVALILVAVVGSLLAFILEK
jgi:hypothetical protein